MSVSKASLKEKPEFHYSGKKLRKLEETIRLEIHDIKNLADWMNEVFHSFKLVVKLYIVKDQRDIREILIAYSTHLLSNIQSQERSIDQFLKQYNIFELHARQMRNVMDLWQEEVQTLEDYIKNTVLVLRKMKYLNQLLRMMMELTELKKEEVFVNFQLQSMHDNLVDNLVRALAQKTEKLNNNYADKILGLPRRPESACTRERKPRKKAKASELKTIYDSVSVMLHEYGNMCFGKAENFHEFSDSSDQEIDVSDSDSSESDEWMSNEPL